MVNLILALLCIGVLTYFVVDNIKTNKRQKEGVAEELKRLSQIYYLLNFLQDYITEQTGWYQVVIRWNNTGNSTTYFTYAKDGYIAMLKTVKNINGENNVDYNVDKVIKVAHCV